MTQHACFIECIRLDLRYETYRHTGKKQSQA